MFDYFVAPGRPAPRPSCKLMSAWFLVVSSVLGSGAVDAQTSTPPARLQNPVAIENTNATFSPTQVDLPQAAPARPTVTMPAHLPPTGYLQFEQGFNQANDSPSGTNAQFALGQTTKIALTTRFLVQFITQPYTYNRLASSPTDSSSNDPGDLQIGVQGIAHKGVHSNPVVAVGYIRRVRAGTSADLDIGSYSQSALVLVSGELGAGYHYDSNLVFNEQNSASVRRGQFSQTFAVSHPLFEQKTAGKLGGVVELSHFTQPFVAASVDGSPVSRANSVNLLFAAVYSVRPNFVLDAAFEHGLTSTSTQWQGSFGFTYVLPQRLWKDRHPVPIAVGPYHYRNTR